MKLTFANQFTALQIKNADYCSHYEKIPRFSSTYIYSWTLPEKNVLNVLFVFKLRASYVSPQIVSALVVVGVEEFVPQ